MLVAFNTPPGPRIGVPSNVRASFATELGVTLQLADSLIPSAGRGLFMCLTEGQTEVMLPSSTPLCGYCEDAMWCEKVTGDKAVPFSFADAQQLVMWQGELQPLQACVIQSRASALFGHTVHRYGPNGAGVMVNPDNEWTTRMLVPMGGEDDRPASLSLCSMGQYANDFAFSGKAALQRPEAFWEYEAASASSNVLTLVWDLELDKQGVLQPREVQLVTTRDLLVNKPLLSVELGLHYGVQYWRDLLLKDWDATGS